MQNESSKMTDDRYFRTSSFYAAAFLFAKGLELVNVDKSEPKRAVFVFRDQPDRELWLNSYNFSVPGSKDAAIDARSYVTAIKALKEKLYQDEFGSQESLEEFIQLVKKRNQE